MRPNILPPASLPRLSRREATHVLRFAASFVWADMTVEEDERAFLRALAEEVGLGKDEPLVEALLAGPPSPESVDPLSVRPGLARTIRAVALRAIAADGRVAEPEMALWDLLDGLLPEAA